MKRRSLVSLDLHSKRRRQGASSTTDNSETPTDVGPPQSNPILTPATSDSEIVVRHPEKTTTRASSTDIEVSSYDDGSEYGTPKKSKKRKLRVQRELSHVAAYGPAFPLSAYEGGTAPAERLSEVDAVNRLMIAHEQLFAKNAEKPEYTYFQLGNFCVYQPPNANWHGLELVGLDRLSQDRYPEFLFDGVLSVGEERCYVEAVPFQTLTVDGYGDRDATDLENQLCFQSKFGQRLAQKRNEHIWFKLGRPAVEYARFYKPFLWLARFTKHFVEYLCETEQVTLHHFWRRFHKWLIARYDDDAFKSWLAEAGFTDFRTTVAANFGFIRKECFGIDFDLLEHPVWREVDPGRLTAIPEQPNVKIRTVVTPYAYECFRPMYFGDQLEKQPIADSVLANVVERRERLGLTPKHRDRSGVLTPLSIDKDSPEPTSVPQVSPRDVVCVRADETSKWKSKATVWFAYVQNVRIVRGRTLLDVLWLYQPRQTTIGKAVYPFPNELFMSDHCECGKDALDLDCVVDKVEVSWNVRDPYAETGHFVRQKYRTVAELDTYDFVALQESDFACHCDSPTPIFEECRSKYNLGDTVLVREYNKRLGEDRLQPAMIVDFDDKNTRVHLQVLLRKSEVESRTGTRPNELVFTDEVIDRPPSMIIRKCHVRFFTQQQVDAGDIPTPYDRRGTGDFWFIADDGQSNDAPVLNQGWHPATMASNPKLTGMGIFCGGGTFDRGLEEGGAVDFRYAVDWAKEALHSYRANVRRPRDVEYFLGSVDDYLGKALAGYHKDCIARVGDVQVISAGSPCPGFSTLQSDRNSHQSRRNASMVASVVSFVDLYVPEYLILENVVNMTYSCAGPNKDENVFSQILAALVGLGYQVQQFLMDAWSYGSSQNRSRVFIVASAPGLPPLPQPNHTHAQPLGISTRALGKTDNNLPFGRRRTDFTPFQHVSAASSVADLPHIGDSQPQICVPFPDHRNGTLETTANRDRMAAVPVRPSEMGLIRARDAGLLRGEPLEYCARVNKVRSAKTSKMYKRIDPDRLFPTIITKLLPQDGVAGQYVHWNQHRVITIMEAKRAQGFLDHEVLIGTHVDQMKIVGNSVDRSVALVLGLGLRESWMGSHQAQTEDEAAGLAIEGREGIQVEDSDIDDGDDANEEDKESDGYVKAEEQSSVVNDRDIDNRTAKIALLDLTEDDLGDIRTNGFKAINRMIAERAAQQDQSTSVDMRAGGARAGGGAISSSS